MMRVWFPLITFCLSLLRAQDLHFSQISQAPLLMNPAAAGVFDGRARIQLNYRNQWLGNQTLFSTSSIATDFKWGKGDLSKQPHLGLGILCFSDVGGDADFGLHSGQLALSGILPMGKHLISLGIQGGFVNQKVNFSELYFHSQWDGTSFNQGMVSGELNGLPGWTFPDASTGIYYVYDSRQNSFQHLDKLKVCAGVSAYHLNKPPMKLIVADAYRLNQKYVAHASLMKDVSSTVWSVETHFVQILQGPHRETLFGFMCKRRFANGAQFTGHRREASFSFGSYFRWNDALCPSMGLDWKGFHLGLSYDVAISSLRKINHGSLELSLSFTHGNLSLLNARVR